MSRTTFWIAALALAWASIAQAEDAQEIVSKADAVRNPDRPFHVTATIIDYKASAPIGRNIYSVYSKLDPATGQFRDVMLYVAPPRDAGKILLLNGDDLWFYDPASRASMRISPQEKLSGQASAGDVLTENLAVDYTASILDSGNVEDGNRAPRDCWHLQLKAISDAATYNRVEYWVEKRSYDPIKAKFYADSGALLKTLYYRNYATQDGRSRPNQAVIIDAVDPSLVTTVDFSEAQFQNIPDAWFVRDYLPHLTIR